eukprot:5325988-Amphidinium_carterae.2
MHDTQSLISHNAQLHKPSLQPSATDRHQGEDTQSYLNPPSVSGTKSADLPTRVLPFLAGPLTNTAGRDLHSEHDGVVQSVANPSQAPRSLHTPCNYAP